MENGIPGVMDDAYATRETQEKEKKKKQRPKTHPILRVSRIHNAFYARVKIAIQEEKQE